MYSSRQEPFLVTETNAQAIGYPWDNRPAYDGQWRQAAWALVSRGARMIEYWHWHTLHFGTETYWGGILPHSGRPGRAYRELARLGAEFETAGDLVAGITPDADIAMVYSAPSKWLMQKYPPLAGADGGPDGGAYEGIFDAFYRGAFEAGRQVRILHARQLHDPRRTPGLHRSRRPSAPGPRRPGAVRGGRRDARLARRVRRGGRPPRPRSPHRVRRPRGEGPPRGDSRRGWREAAGVRVRRVQQPGVDLPVRAAPDSSAAAAGRRGGHPLGGRAGRRGTPRCWPTYDHPHFGRWPAVTTRRHGAGRVTYVGTVPGRELARALAVWLAPAPASGWQDLPDSVTVATGAAPDGRRVHVVHNWSWQPVTVQAPVDLSDALDGGAVPAGTSVELGAWDVRVLAAPQER